MLVLGSDKQPDHRLPGYMKMDVDLALTLQVTGTKPWKTGNNLRLQEGVQFLWEMSREGF